MSPSPTTPKVEELRFRLKTDPKSRLFFPLAEELRKINQWAEAEGVLRAGLTNHPTYLSAWVSLGRVLREEGNNAEAIDALNKAMQLDPGNVVAARLLADVYLATGEKVEAIKKYKLVQALMPGDNDLAATIEQLDRELQPPVPAVETPEEAPQEAAEETPHETARETAEEAPVALAPEPFEEPLPFPVSHDQDIATGDVEPMHVAHAESPFEEPVTDFTEAAVEIEEPAGVHVETAPLGAETPTPWTEEEPADVFAPSEEAVPGAEPEEPTYTVTMADLYAKQGLTDDARRIYEILLQRDPENDVVREKLAALGEGEMRNQRVARLEQWLSKVARREVSRV